MTTETKFTVGEYKTRDGRRARVYATDGGGEEPIHGAVLEDDGVVWEPQSWGENGSWIGYEKHGADLMPPLREWWVVAGEAWDNESECRAAANLLHNRPEIIRVREVRDDQA